MLIFLSKFLKTCLPRQCLSLHNALRVCNSSDLSINLIYSSVLFEILFEKY
ncbi:unnamed protein product [Moneuplotes crassus]|uniref:Uncharacterized protein n=1 Tax=Euplotes crassus TaxID=5936 RepID=A0AAD1Y4I5_EUPCR|nr:unnamed protein product [Moneuplotes crassus]